MGRKRTVQQTMACLILEAWNAHELEALDSIGARSEK